MKKRKANKSISLFWCLRDHGTKNNFGDDMSPLLLEYATGRSVSFAKPKKADVIGLGSILQLLCSRKQAVRSLAYRAINLRRLRPVVWGSGTTGMDASGTMALTDFVPWHLDVRALRGPATERMLRVRCNAFGDPALLASKIWPTPSYKTHRIGIIPHYTDMASPELEQVKSRFPDAKIISVENHVDQVVREIASCELILSSSLHGLIVSDSFGIPNYRLVLGGKLTGGDFKFLDYADGIGRPDISPVSLEGDEKLFAGNFDYQKYLDDISERLIKSISDLAVYL
ncbi:polysaccharide pyruvyl transferase family protein [Tritonibacter mobilis]|uniref:polysaccharide pyruvyl transferase family protein n=1 Tax=Tritonibacter mobilis TaxID=379347 RepID=UPI001401C9BF|nr:polysaccharide pyruvyl transferase family protein [Tritonibacter mobilis]NHM21143.1 polysaccharide pyruvyl transferase family protein [Tritonibacter mobilis]NHM25300.1 polysaccharide pyruvyl transferase family protein [Tritonibacter mobilis]